MDQVMNVEVWTALVEKVSNYQVKPDTYSLTVAKLTIRPLGATKESSRSNGGVCREIGLLAEPDIQPTHGQSW